MFFVILGDTPHFRGSNLPNGGFDRLATLSARGWVGAKCDFWKPMGRTTGGEELNRDPRRLVTPMGSADTKNMM